MLAGSAFGGVGGMELGFAWAGIRTAWSIEVNVHRRRVLKRHFPRTRVYSDVEFVDIEYDLGYVDVIMGGFPCRDTSNAGLRAGINGKQSGLFFNFLGIVAQIRPQWVVIENVSGLLGNGMEAVIGGLAALGYMGEWESIPARTLGAIHRRDRVWIVARLQANPVASNHAVAVQHGRDLADPAAFATWSDRHDRGVPAPCWAGDEPLNTTELGSSYLPDASTLEDLYAEPERIFCARALAAFSTLCQAQWQAEPAVARVADGLSAGLDGATSAESEGLPDDNWLDRVAALGDSLVPYIPCYIAHRIAIFQG